ncbi:hypothetical protein AAFC00_000500 [Neodothiora populina]|uniref:Uncharacterized protein n=1 Tax=Neodothiora populina TaxID=2781224 RepID=A0ABR3PD33_9PEZI
MAQGTVKQKVVEPKKRKDPGSSRGARIVKPKKAALVKQNNLKKKHSAGLISLTEKRLAERAGHLEMIKGGKKERDDKAKAKAAALKNMGRK